MENNFKFLLSKKVSIVGIACNTATAVIQKEYPQLLDSPLIFNPMTSLYDTVVLDRKMFREGSIKAKFTHFIDKLSFKLADIVCADTLEHKKYFVEEFKLNPRKVKTLYIGAQEYLFFPRKTKRKGYIKVLFYGKFTPLHGMSYILKSAKSNAL